MKVFLKLLTVFAVFSLSAQAQDFVKSADDTAATQEGADLGGISWAMSMQNASERANFLDALKRGDTYKNIIRNAYEETGVSNFGALVTRIFDSNPSTTAIKLTTALETLSQAQARLGHEIQAEGEVFSESVSDLETAQEDVFKALSEIVEARRNLKAFRSIDWVTNGIEFVIVTKGLYRVGSALLNRVEVAPAAAELFDNAEDASKRTRRASKAFQPKLGTAFKKGLAYTAVFIAFDYFVDGYVDSAIEDYSRIASARFDNALRVVDIVAQTETNLQKLDPTRRSNYDKYGISVEEIREIVLGGKEALRISVETIQAQESN